jgi:hypothetical protein
MTTATRLTAAFASIVLSLALFQGVASLAEDGQVAAPQQLATATSTLTVR